METSTIAGKIINALFFLIFFIFTASVLVTIGQLLSSNPEIDVLTKMKLAAPISISGGVLIAILTYTNTIQKNQEDKDRHQSEVILKYCSGGFTRVLDMLADQNNSNLIWSQACKILLGTVSLGRKISNTEFIDAYKIEEAKCRASLYHYLSLHDGDEKSSPEGLPPTFFYGVRDWQFLTIQSRNEKLQYESGLYDCSEELDKAREVATSRTLAGKIHEYTLITSLTNTAIDTTPVIVLYSFLASKDILSDDLRNEFVDWSSEQYHFGEEFFQGALLYIKHRLNNPIGLALAHDDVNERVDTTSYINSSLEV